jgi:cell division protein FtsI/penicillin-binding protein 2
MAEKFGFNDDKLDIPVRAYTSVYPSNMNKSSTALTGIGQYDVTATPLQMAMVSAAIANDGKLVSPHMVSETTDSGGDVVHNYDDSTTTKQIVSSRTAQQLQSAMQTVIENGTGTNAQISGVTVGGKTGTAQHGENNDQSPGSRPTASPTRPAKRSRSRWWSNSRTRQGRKSAATAWRPRWPRR